MNKNEKERKQFLAWIAATIAFAIVALLCITDTTPDLQFDAPVIVFLCVIWVIVSFLIRKFIKANL